MKGHLLQGMLLAISSGTAVADVPFSRDAAAYNAGALGDAPNQTFHSSEIVAPIFQVNKFEPEEIDNAPFLFLEFTINNVSSPMIFRSDDLSLVYADPSYPLAQNARIQKLGGERYLTFWGGESKLRYGNGHSLVFDNKYNLKYDITPVGLANARLSDEHEFQFTDDGTVLITVYESIIWDFTEQGGPPDGVLLDQLFQEIDPRTGKLLFSWRASDHFPITDSFNQYPEDIRPDGEFDFFHMNSVAKYDDSYLVGSRGLHSVILVDKDGDTIWVLGGKNNQFKDLSDGRALNFAEQHMPRLKGKNHLTLFDNHVASNTVGCETDCSRGIELELDFEGFTAQLVHEYYHPIGLQSVGRGGFTALKNGNALIAWGTQPAITEHKGDKLVMDIQIGRLVNSAFVPGANAPYRAFRMDWHGKPTWGPSIAIDLPSVFVSWNGATELNRWVVIGTDRVDEFDARGGKRKELAKSNREGFETEIIVSGCKTPRYVRAYALDSKGKVLGCTPAVDSESGEIVRDGKCKNRYL